MRRRDECGSVELARVWCWSDHDDAVQRSEVVVGLELDRLSEVLTGQLVTTIRVQQLNNKQNIQPTTISPLVHPCDFPHTHPHVCPSSLASAYRV